jgi:uncharacterized protein (UPF0262 family)
MLRPLTQRKPWVSPASSRSDLDERSIIRRNEDIEQEKRVAIFDLLERQSFGPGRQDARSAW